MGQVVVKINGRDFPLTCADGQEPRIRRLAQYVDGKVGEFARILGQVGEARLILLAAITIADELSDSNEAVQRERDRNRGVRSPAGGNTGATGSSGPAGPRSSDSAAAGIRGVAQRIEGIAARIERS